MNTKLIVPVLITSACCSGCFTSHLAWVEGPEPEVPNKINGSYEFVSDTIDGGAKNVSEVNVKREALRTLRKIEQSEGDKLEVTVSTRKLKMESTEGTAAMVNNFFSFFTLGVWPFFRSQEQPCVVTISGYGKRKEKTCVIGHRSWSSFILPICALPCPGWGDWRNSEFFSLGEKCGPGQETWEGHVVAGYVCEMLTDGFTDELKKGKDGRGQLRALAIRKLREALQGATN